MMRGMDIALTIFAVALAAFVVWLTIRIVNRRERWAKWTLVAVVVVAFVGYPMSIGPVRWLVGRGYLPSWTFTTISTVYAPFDWPYIPQPLDDALSWYCSLWD